MPTEVILPKVDMDMATGRISKWYVAEGASVKKGDVLFEIETDKAAMEIDSPESGTIANITGKEGIDIPVGDVVAYIYAEGEAVGAGAAPASAVEAKTDSKQVEAPKDKASAPAPQATPAAPEGEGVRATPLARRLAKEAGLDLSSVKGSGPRGRIVSADVQAAAKDGAGAAKAEAADAPVRAEAAPAAVAKGMSDEAILKLYEEGSYEVKPHDSMRRTIAKRLVESKQTVPHFYLSLDCEIDALLKLRTELNAGATKKGDKPAYKLSVNDFVIKALAMALSDVPAANASWTEGGMLLHKHSDVGVAVALEGGLITPIVRKAEQKTLSTISNEVKDLAARAKEKKLKAEEYQGGTTSVSNLGMFGIKNFSAVINPPQGTILAVGAGEERVIAKNGEFKIANVMSVTLSCDHRAVDGALGAELLAAFKARIENPTGMLV
ncbi:pyruvate dehydrogenase complex dihydrolipoamide acetyltransferase [Limoniibacter endophyticus]|uniref:Acetyltransferase component of pyruvate dehydrogenase complex n=1 Tax=Limoniibacter endophyticus TaxID=1565040 RepID=A0A8J3GIZ1_9HYPH|nr:pyruvate dehydrogenase complex dihydrolipoamide acetyltransferase [Limoniibacter endophyticus]GHC74952.1 acetyltransferase component of pyruvate dehydrogenase complex [Limoniibacter endophyticus]